MIFLKDINLANNVFPVPGGPYIKTPFGGLIPTLINNSGLEIGSSIVYIKYMKYIISAEQNILDFNIIFYIKIYLIHINSYYFILLLSIL